MHLFAANLGIDHAGLPSVVAHFLMAGTFWITHSVEMTTAIAAFLVGIVVGFTGMGGGALMTPALIFLGVGHLSSVITADLAAAAIYKSGGALVHWRKGSPNLRLAGFLIFGSVPMAFLGPHLVRWINPTARIDVFLAVCVGFACLLGAGGYALRFYAEMRRKVKGARRPGPLVIRAAPTILIGALGGLLVGITSIGSGSIIMIALLMLYPGLAAVQLVATDLVQAVPLVLAGAISNIAVNGLDLSIAIPLVIGSVPGCIIGARIAPLLRPSYIRRGVVVVLTMSGLALLDKQGWGTLLGGDEHTHPTAIAGIGVCMLLSAPLVWGILRRSVGLPMFPKDGEKDMVQASARVSASLQGSVADAERARPLQ